MPSFAVGEFQRATPVRCLAGVSFAPFRAAIQAALPPETWLEPDPNDRDATDPGPPPPDALQIRCVRHKCVKGIPRMTAKVKAAQDDAANPDKKSEDVWPFTATIGDVLRASVTASDAAGIRRAWDCIHENMRVIRLKNKFREAASRLLKDGSGAFTTDLRDDQKNMFPNLHINVLFQADGCAPIVAEVQVHHERVLAVAKQDHKLYEVVRAESIAALAGAGRSITIQQVMDETEALKAMGAELAELREQLRRHEDGGVKEGPNIGAGDRGGEEPGGAGINAARALRVSGC